MGFKTNKSIHIYKKGNVPQSVIIIIAIFAVIAIIFTGSFAANYNKEQITDKLRQMSILFSETLNTSVKQNGDAKTWIIGKDSSERASYEFFQKYLKPYMDVSRDCKNVTKGQCNFEYREMNSSIQSLDITWTRFFLKEGEFIAVKTFSAKGKKVLYIIVDINGKRNLNVFGRDIFMFEYWIQNDENESIEGKVLPYGHEYTRSELLSSKNENNCNIITNGKYCSAVIVKDKWRILSGYPWTQARYGVKED